MRAGRERAERILTGLAIAAVTLAAVVGRGGGHAPVPVPPKPRLLRPAALALLLVTASAGLAAWLLFPKDHPVEPGTGIPVFFMADFHPLLVKVYLAPDIPCPPTSATSRPVVCRPAGQAPGTAIGLVVSSTREESSQAKAWVLAPPDTWGHGCDRAAIVCSARSSRDAVYTGALYQLPGWKLDPTSDTPTYAEELWIDLPGVAYVAHRNAEYAAIALPPVVFENQRAGVSETTDAHVYVSLPQADRYTWTAPETIPIAGPGSVLWTYPTAMQAGTPVLASGVSLSTQSLATTLSFLAGALVGVAGSALIAFVQELLSHD